MVFVPNNVLLNFAITAFLYALDAGIEHEI